MRCVIVNLDYHLRQEKIGRGKKRHAVASSSGQLLHGRHEYGSRNLPGVGLEASTGTASDTNGSIRPNHFLSEMDRHSVQTYAYRVVEQLRLCDRIVKSNNGTTPKYICGFECVHCRRKKRPFRRFPETTRGVANEILNFEAHLRRCEELPSDDRHFLKWMGSWHSLGKSMGKLTRIVSRRLDAEELKGNAALMKAKTKRDLSKKRAQLHSILENVASLESVELR